MLQNANLVSNVYFPRLVLPISAPLSALIDFLVSLPLLVLFMFIWHITPTWGLLLVPVWVLLLMMLSLGVGLIAGGLTVHYRDVQYVLPVVVQFLLFISPVWYPRSAMPPKYHLLYTLNPLSGLMDGFRWSVLGMGELNLGALTYTVLVSVAMLIIGAYSFRSMERRFADVI